MTAFYLTVSLLPAVAAAASQNPVSTTPVRRADPSPDELFARRENIDNAKRAADLWAARAASGTDFEAAWKLARVCFHLGTLGPMEERRVALERGVQAGQQASKIEPNKPDGHFWTAANMGRLAQSFGLGQGLKYRGPIKNELQQVIAIEPGWSGASGEIALAQWYQDVPWLFGGSHDKAIELLRKALSYDPENSEALYDLAELLAEKDQTKDEARTLLQKVIDAPVDPEWATEHRIIKAKAAALLAKLHKR